MAIGVNNFLFRAFLRFQRLIVFLCVIFIVAACSFKTLYNQLDSVIPSYVEGMVTLDEMLEEKVEERTSVLIRWHRNTQLKQYADLLRAYQKDFNAELTVVRVEEHMESMEALWLPLKLKLNEEMALLLPLLNKSQLDELFESIEDKNEDFYEKYIDLDNDTLLDEYNESLYDNYEYWLGGITDEQEKEITKSAYNFVSSAPLRLQYRKKWQQGLREILYSTTHKETKEKKLTEFFHDFHVTPDVALDTADKVNKENLARLTVQLVQMASPDQKKYFLEMTDDYIRIFTELSEEN